MTQLMAACSVWEPKLDDAEVIQKLKNHRSEIEKIKPNLNLYYQNKTYISKQICEHKMLGKPSGVAFDSTRDYVFVACPGMKPKVIVMDKKFKMLRKFHHTEMVAPQRVAYFEETEELFVTDNWKHCIFVFNRKGEYLRKMCNKGREKGQLLNPEGISIHPRQRIIYVADTGNDRIVILDFNGFYQGSIGEIENLSSTVNILGRTISISGNHLNQPTDVAVSLDEVVVADSGNHKIKIFNHKGEFLQSFGGLGVMRGLFKTPEVVKIDNKRNIIVGDSGNGRIQIFSRQGELLKTFGGKGSKAGEFGWISGLIIKSNLDIIVSDNKNNNVQLF